MNKLHRNIILFVLLGISILMHFNLFTRELMSIHVWRQTQTQSTIDNFYEEDMNPLNPRRNDRGNGDGIFRMEFPIMQWLVACLYKVFGNHLVISRLTMFVIGWLSVLGIYNLLYQLFRKDILALMGAWAFNFSPSFYYYTINPMPDNFALCCSIWGLAFFFAWYRKNRRNLLLISGLLLSLGALSKLPFLLYYIVPLTWFIRLGSQNGFNKKTMADIAIIFSFVLLPISWYYSVIPHWSGNGIVKGILESSLSSSVYFYYLRHNLLSTLPELLLNYGSLLFFASGFYFMYVNKLYKSSLFGVFILWSLVLVLFFLFELNMIGTIHDYYLFPFYPVLFIPVAYGAYHLFFSKGNIFKYLVIFLLLLLPLTAYLRMQIRWQPDSPGFNKDLLIYKEELRNAVPKNALCIAGNDESHFIFFYYIDKKGWGFQDDSLCGGSISEMIRHGARYLYSDSRKLENNEHILPYLDKLILEKGSVRIYQLKQ